MAPSRRTFIGAAAYAGAGALAWSASADAQTTSGSASTMTTSGTKYGLTGKFVAQPGKRDALAARLMIAAEKMSAAPGCHLYIVHTSPTEADAVWVSEVWRSEEDHNTSLDLPGVREFIKETMPLIAGFGERIVTVPLGGHGLPKD